MCRLCRREHYHQLWFKVLFATFSGKLAGNSIDQADWACSRGQNETRYVSMEADQGKDFGA